MGICRCPHCGNEHQESEGLFDDEVSPAREIFAYWQSVMGRSRAKLTSDRREKIGARLREGYTVKDIKVAIDGCANSDHHMGRARLSNPGGTLYNDLTLICRTGSKLEFFMQMKPQNNRARDMQDLDQ